MEPKFTVSAADIFTRPPIKTENENPLSYGQKALHPVIPVQLAIGQ